MVHEALGDGRYLRGLGRCEERVAGRHVHGGRHGGRQGARVEAGVHVTEHVDVGVDDGLNHVRIAPVAPCNTQQAVTSRN